MRVICISKDKPGDHPDLRAAADQLQVGEIYNVIDEDEDRYELDEFPHPLQIMWDKQHFLPLSDTPAEVIEEKETELETA